MDKYQENLLQAIDIIVEERLKNLKFNYTITGKVTEVIDSVNYKALINNEESKVKAINGQTYLVNDVVYVLMQNNNKSDRLILCKIP